MRRLKKRVLAALTGAVLALPLASCGAVPPSSPGETTAGPAGDLPSPSTEIPSESPAPTESTPATPKPTPTKTPEPAGPNCDKLKCIALTYDDGPFPYTSELVATLRREKVKATFFMLGQNVEKYPQAAREIHAAGSELANHSWNHPDLTGLSNSGMRSQLQRTDDAIQKATGVEPTLMRPPYGANNRRLDQVCRELGLAEIYWNVDTMDWQDKDTGALIDIVLGSAARDNVVLMHDIHPSTVKAAPAIIKGLKKKGYTLVTVSELFPKLRPGGHYPEFNGRGLAKKSDLPKRMQRKH